MAHKPTNEQRQMVECLYGCGMPLDDIARLLKISRKTLSARYKEELKIGKIRMDAVAIGKLFQKIRAGNTACLIFYMKTRMGWRTSGELPDFPHPPGPIDAPPEMIEELSEEALDKELQRRGLAHIITVQ